jgi:hypothetical protein
MQKSSEFKSQWPTANGQQLLSLTLLVLRVLANDADDVLTTNDLALGTNLLH